MGLAVFVSILAMTAIVAIRYLAVSGGFALLTARVRPGLYRGQSPQIKREVGWSLASAVIYGAPAGLLAWGWQEHGWTRIYSDVSEYPLWWLPTSALVYLLLHDTYFLLDAQMDAPARFVPGGACGSSFQQASDRLGSDELSPGRGADRRHHHPFARLRGPNPLFCFALRALDHDLDGCDQSYGLGAVSAPAGRGGGRTLADHG